MSHSENRDENIIVVVLIVDKISYLATYIPADLKAKSKEKKFFSRKKAHSFVLFSFFVPNKCSLDQKKRKPFWKGSKKEKNRKSERRKEEMKEKKIERRKEKGNGQSFSKVKKLP